MNRTTKIGITAVVAVFMVMGVAIAAWLVQGTGTGSAKAGSAVALGVSPVTEAVVGDLYPGSEGGDVYVTVTNTNAFPVTLTEATIAGPVTPANCLVTVNDGPFALGSPPITIAAGATADVTIVDALSMGLAADNTCQGAALVVTGVTVKGAAG